MHQHGEIPTERHEPLQLREFPPQRLDLEPRGQVNHSATRKAEQRPLVQILDSSFVCQKFVVARTDRPSANVSVPPPDHVLILNDAISSSESHGRTVARVDQKPTRLNVQHPSPLSAVANEPNELRNFNVAATASFAHSSYSERNVLGCRHSSVWSRIWEIFFI